MNPKISTLLSVLVVATSGGIEPDPRNRSTGVRISQHPGRVVVVRPYDTTANDPYRTEPHDDSPEHVSRQVDRKAKRKAAKATRARRGRR